MAVRNPYETYRNQSVMLASREELTLMLYNGCANFIRKAMAAIDESDVQEAHTNIIKAQNIITELMSTLNMDYEVSKGLMSLYTYMLDRLIEANINKDKEILTEVLDMAVDLSETWSQAMSMTGRKKVSAKG